MALALPSSTSGGSFAIEKGFNPNTIGELDDKVRLVLGGDEVLIAETYECKCSIFTQPAAWSIRLGHGNVVAQLIKRYPPRTPFQLFIGKTLQQTGRIDTPGAEDSIGGTEFTVRGRDLLAPLHDDLIADERTFTEPTYAKLVRKHLDEVGLQSSKLIFSNRANREIKAGVRIVELLPPRTVEQIITNAQTTGETTGITHQAVQAKLGERRYEFLKRWLDLAGLFLWAGADGNFILSEPNGNQQPSFLVSRKLTDTRETTNVKRGSYENATEHRYSEYSVYGRGAGRKGGHAIATGTFVDDEMVALGFTKTKTIRNSRVRTKTHGEFIARRHCAEDRRAGFKLHYTMSGHTTPALTGGRLVYGPDLVGSVKDELFGINDDFYVSDVTYRQAPQTETELVFTKLNALVFGGLEAEN